MSNHYVSILIPVKNVEKYIKTCIESVLNQTYDKFELIILDDSEDNTINIIKEYSDSRIKLIRFDGNISQKLNYGIKIAQYDYICRMDGDDIMAPNRLEKQVRFLNSNPNVDILGSNFFAIDKNDVIMYQKRLPELHDEIEFMMPIMISLLHPAIMMKKSRILKFGLYNESLNFAEDLDLFLRNAGDLKYYNLQEPLVYYRIYHQGDKKQSEVEAYKLGLKYLKDILNAEKGDRKTLFRIALLEYYKNDISKSRKIFLSILFSKSRYSYKTLRYLFPSILGNKLLKKIRYLGISQLINKLIIRNLKYDTNKIIR